MTILREWECPECGLVFRGQYPPDECPGCGEPFADLTVYDLSDEDDWLEDENEGDEEIADILDGDALDAEFLNDAERALVDELLAEDVDAEQDDLDGPRANLDL